MYMNLLMYKVDEHSLKFLRQNTGLYYYSFLKYFVQYFTNVDIRPIYFATEIGFLAQMKNLYNINP